MYLIKSTLFKFIQVIEFLIFARIVISWVARGRSNQLIDLVYQLTEPILAPFRNLQQKLGINIMLDFSPLMAYLTLGFLKGIIAAL